ncbi:MAG: toll/interleukin-1 receptor domain-containing protein, partial [Clostridiales bacterium]|nr:toll/interleukin-1 receptor domain-containing protein [Clostridiales bacterium]
DVFICYKETDESGRRTQDSVIANDLYHQLTQEGFKVFFSRITLEDKIGTAYEPYIFAALNSAKVMVVLGTKPEYFNAVWVKNEWSRFLALVRESNGKKMLVPAYRDMDPYDLPEEFSHLQAQDMSKLGFMQDLIRGIKKIAAAGEPKETLKEPAVLGVVNTNIAPLLERAFLFLEDGKWQDANIYCEKVLDIDPKNPEAYLGKLMAELQVRSRKQLAECNEPFDDRENYSKVLRFGDQKLEAEIRGYIAHINERNENARLTGIYNNAVNAMNTADNESAYKSAAEIFKTISGFKDADELVGQCFERAEVCRKDAIYASGRSQMTGFDVRGYETAINVFRTISGWKDADEQIYACQRKIEEIKAKEEADRLERERQAELERIAAEKAAKKRKRIIAITTPIAVACIAFLVVLITVIIPGSKYNSAMKLYNAQKYEDAYNAFNALKYKDSVEKADECLFLKQKSGLTNISVGSTIKFGFYEQDNNTSNGKEEIEWKVLAVNGNKALIISQYALDCKQYNNTYTDTTWENCTLRTWINGMFYDTAFGADHKKMIADSTVTSDKNPEYSTSPGNNTTDKVFLLSITEVNDYFASDSARQCQGTAYCYAQGACQASNGNCWWWLRAPGYYSDFAAYVYFDGSVFSYGNDVYNDFSAVRPALWINLES